MLSALKKTLRGFSLKDMYNITKCGLNYSIQRDKTVVFQPFPGHNKLKERLTLLFCSDVDGSNKFEKMLIRTAPIPHLLTKNSGKQLAFDYYNNEKTWMTTSWFLAGYIGSKITLQRQKVNWQFYWSRTGVPMEAFCPFLPCLTLKFNFYSLPHRLSFNQWTQG